jgi:hypothetical protein
MSDPPRQSGRPATGWAVTLLITSVLFAGSLALPWAREEWTEQTVRGWSVLFAGDEYPPLGALLVAAWGTALVTTLRRANRGVLAATAAVMVCGLCPGYYGWEITRDRGWGIGQNADGDVVEWSVTATPEIGYYLATLCTIALLVVVLLRIRRARRAD